MKTKKRIRKTTAVVLIGFGLLSLFMSASVIFDLFGIREKEGNYVPFVVWANFICSFLYLFAAKGFLKSRLWTKVVLVVASIILIITFLALKSHISDGGIYEEKTISAMIFRIIITLIFSLIAFYSLHKHTPKLNRRS